MPPQRARRSTILVRVIIIYCAIVIAWFLLNRILGDVWWVAICTWIYPLLFLPWPLALAGALWTRRRAAWAGLGIVALVMALTLGPLFVPKSGNSSPGQEAVRVMTFNILGSDRPVDDSANMLRALAPDLVAMQEISGPQFDQLADSLDDLYPHRITNDAGLRSHVAIFSQHPFADSGFFEISPDWPAIWVDVDLDGREVRFINAHLAVPLFQRLITDLGTLPQKTMEILVQREVQAQAIGAVVAEALAQGRTVWFGCDCNSTDQHAIYRQIEGFGLRDSFREVGWGLGYTFPGSVASEPPMFNYFGRIDYVWHTPDTRALDAQPVELPTNSDHRPLLVTLGWE